MLAIAACTGEIEIDGQGDVLSSDGNNCYLEYNGSCKEVFTEGFTRTLTAVPRSGNRFVGWEYCQQSRGNQCKMDVTTNMIKEGFFKDLPPITAKFEPAKVRSIEAIPASCDAMGSDINGDFCSPHRFYVSTSKNYISFSIEWTPSSSGTHYAYATGEYVITDTGWVFSGECGTSDNYCTSVTVIVDGKNLTIVHYFGRKTIYKGVIQ